MKIASKRLILRPFRQNDVNDIFNYSSDPQVTKYMTWGPNTIDETYEFVKLVIERNKDTPRIAYDFIVALKETNTVIGACGIYFDPSQNNVPSLGWILHKGYWNKGYGTELAKSLLSFGFNTLKLTMIRATCLSENVGSYRIMEKIGMRFVKEIPCDLKYKNYFRERVYELTALEYKLNNHKTII